MPFFSSLPVYHHIIVSQNYKEVWLPLAMWDWNTKAEMNFNTAKACSEYLFDTRFNWESHCYVLVKSKDLELEQQLSC